MGRKRNELVPIGEVFSDPDDGPLKALREASPQAVHHFTQADQVNQLVGASEADPDLGFMARLMALCSLPRTNPGDRKEYKRVNGPYTLYMVAGGGNKLPFGNLPRLLLAWVSTEAVRTKSRELVLGRSLAEFMRTLGIYHNSGGRGGVQTRLRNQMDRLFSASVQLIYEDEHGKQFIASHIADRGEFWWNERKPDERVLWESKIHLSEPFFNEIIQHPVPARYEHPDGTQTLYGGSRSLPVVGLPHLYPPRSATALLASGLPSVWSAPGQGQRQAHR